MTEQEAIEILENHTQYYIPNNGKDIQAYNMAISALEKQIKLQIWIEHYKKKDTLLFDKNNVISLLEEFRLE